MSLVSLTILPAIGSSPVDAGAIWGEAVWGEETFGGGPSNEYLTSVLVKNISYTRAVNGSIGTLEFTLVLPYGQPPVDVGATVSLSSSEGVDFTGTICRVSPTKVRNSPTSPICWACACQDETRLLESVAVGIERFSGMSDAAVIAYLFGKYLTTIDTSNVQTIVSDMPLLEVTGKTLRQCLEAISAVTQGIWYVEPGAVLQYHDSMARMAPFSIAENADGISTEAARIEDFSLTREFSAPCNSAEVRNIPNEVVLVGEYNTPASGDDGFTTLTDDAFPPDGTATADVDNNSIRVERTRVNYATTDDHVSTPTVGSGGSDGTLWRTGTGWPPAPSSCYLEDAESTLRIHASCFSGVNYVSSHAILGFDTSAIPSDAEVLSAALALNGIVYYESIPSQYPYYLSIDWMPEKLAPPIELSDFEATPEDTYLSALGSLRINTISTAYSFGLNQAAAGVHKSGYTFVRMFIYAAGIPVGDNHLEFDSSESGAHAPVLTVTYRQAGTTYTAACAHVRFDTSALPADAEITSAVLWIKPSLAPVNADGGSVGVEWYAASNWPIGAADHSNTASNAAGGYTALTSLVIDTLTSFTLSGADVNVNLAGYTGIRIHAYTSATPTGENSVEFYSKDSAGIPARLVINYITGGAIVGTYDDLLSQAQYGIFRRVVVNASLESEAEGDLQAQALVLQGAWPHQAMRCKVSRAGLNPGQWVQINFPAFGINEAFLIRAMSVKLEAKTPVYVIDVGDFRPDLIQFLRQQALR